VKLRRVIVSSLAEETFHATLELERRRPNLHIDARRRTRSPWLSGRASASSPPPKFSIERRRARDAG